MKHLKLLLSLFLIGSVFFSCKKLPDGGLYFSTNVPPEENVFYLTLDGTDEGNIQYNDGCICLEEQTFIQTKRGKHTYKIHDENDLLVSEGSFRVSNWLLRGGDHNFSSKSSKEEYIILIYED